MRLTVWTGCVALALCLAAPRAKADTFSVAYINGVTETDNGSAIPVEATIFFDIGNGVLTVTLTNNMVDTFYNSENISVLAFQVANGATMLTGPAGTNTLQAASSSGNVQTVTDTGGKAGTYPASDIVNSTTAVVPTTSNTVDWYEQNIGNGTYGNAASAGGGANQITLGQDAFVLATATDAKGIDGTNSIVGASNGGYYNVLTPPAGWCAGTKGGDCNSGNPIVGSYDAPQYSGQMIYSTATFTFDISGLLPSSTISNIWIGFGPDGPDLDDWLGGGLLDPAPEPASLILCGIGVALLGGSQLRRLRGSKRPTAV